MAQHCVRVAAVSTLRFPIWCMFVHCSTSDTRGDHVARIVLLRVPIGSTNWGEECMVQRGGSVASKRGGVHCLLVAAIHPAWRLQTGILRAFHGSSRSLENSVVRNRTHAHTVHQRAWLRGSTMQVRGRGADSSHLAELQFRSNKYCHNWPLVLGRGLCQDSKDVIERCIALVLATQPAIHHRGKVPATS